jgi:putative transposase
MRSVSRKESERRKRLVQQQEASGVGVVEFCSNRGLDPMAFYVWRRKLRANENVLFREVELRPETPSSSSSIEVRYGECLIGFSSLPDPKWLASLVCAFGSVKQEVSC